MSDLPSLLVGVPVLGRPQNAAPLVANLCETTPSADVLFICSPGDNDEIEACVAVTLEQDTEGFLVTGWEPGPADFARKQNAGYEYAVTNGYDFYFCGADDLRFQSDWYLRALIAQGKREACVVGTNDLHNQNVIKGWYATHFLVHRDYLACGGVVDDPTKLLCELYDHQAVDLEFCGTARWRRTYVHAFDSRVEHLHPHWRLAEMDDTYTKALRATQEDQALYMSRRHLWNDGRPG